MLYTLNNPQDLGPEYLKASFSGKINCGTWERRWATVWRDRHASALSCWNPSHRSKTVYVRQWSLFDYVITVIGSLCCSSWSTVKVSFTKFWNSRRNRKVL